MTLLWSLIDPIAPGSGQPVVADRYALLAGIRPAGAEDGAAISLAGALAAASGAVATRLHFCWHHLARRFVRDRLAAGSRIGVFDGRPQLERRVPGQAIALGLLAFGVLLRPNALAAAPILATYILWPWHFSWKRLAILYLPMALGLYGLVQVVYYDVLGATRQHPLHSIMVFDLGGISHFARDNVFPGSWTADETALITEDVTSRLPGTSIGRKSHADL